MKIKKLINGVLITTIVIGSTSFSFAEVKFTKDEVYNVMYEIFGKRNLNKINKVIEKLLNLHSDDVEEDTTETDNSTESNTETNTDNKDTESSVENGGYTLVFEDNFNSLNLNNWTVLNTGEVYNNEIQYYRKENVTVEDGNLVITAKKEPYGGKSWTSGRIESINKKEFQYGKIEARIKLPNVQGSFPAFWTLRANGSYPEKYGEIDIMEHVNKETTTYNTVWYYNGNGENFGSYKSSKSNIDVTQYHKYGIEWTEDEIIFYVDDVETGRMSGLDKARTGLDNPLRSPHYLLLNLAVGGDWAGNPDSSTTEMKMYVDWVRVYSNDNQSSAISTLTSNN